MAWEILDPEVQRLVDAIAEGARFRRGRWSQGGRFYIVQLVPDLDPRRVKLGWAVDPLKRLAQHRCAAPTAQLLGTWPCANPRAEKAAIRTIADGYHALSGEVFDCDSIDALLSRTASYFALLTGRA